MADAEHREESPFGRATFPRGAGLRQVAAGCWLAGLLVIGAGPAGAAAPDGRLLFLRECAPCHGEQARGDGPDAPTFLPKPRNLRDGVLGRYDAATLARTIRDGAALPLALDPVKLQERAGDVEDIVAHVQRLPDVDWRLVERGEEIYVDRCELCHGPTGQPPANTPAGMHRPQDLSSPVFQRSLDDEDLRTVVGHGRHGMPAIPALRQPDDARALVAYVRLLSPGYRLYDRYCASCHGEDGRADEVVDPGRVRPLAFDRAWLAKQDPEALRTKVWHMLAERRPAMPHFRGKLTDADVRAIVAWLKSLPPER